MNPALRAALLAAAAVAAAVVALASSHARRRVAPPPVADYATFVPAAPAPAMRGYGAYMPQPLPQPVAPPAAVPHAAAAAALYGPGYGETARFFGLFSDDDDEEDDRTETPKPPRPPKRRDGHAGSGPRPSPSPRAQCSETGQCGCSVRGWCWQSCGSEPYNAAREGRGMWCWSSYLRGTRNWLACTRADDCATLNTYCGGSCSKSLLS